MPVVAGKVATSGFVMLGLVQLTLVGVWGAMSFVTVGVFVVTGALGGASTKKTVTSRA